MGTKRGVAKNPPATVVNLDDPQQLDELATRALSFARRRAKVYRWMYRGADALAKGHTVEDIAQTAIVSLFGAKRRWNPGTQPDPFEYVKSTINSELWDLACNAENRKTDRASEDYDHAAAVTPLTDALDAEDAAEEKKQRDRFHELLIEEIGTDATLVKLYDLFFEQDIDKPRELAPRLGITVLEVNNLKKRFMRACEKVGAAMLAAEEQHE